MNTEPVAWSQEKQQRLQEHLVGVFAEDIWRLKGSRGWKRPLSFSLFRSPPLKIEVKYAAWCKFDSGEWKCGSDQHVTAFYLNNLAAWLNAVAPDVPSFMVHRLEHWEISLRSYLIQRGLYKRRKRKDLRATQEYQEYEREDQRIALFRQFYRIIADAYDDRPAMEKDIWDLRKMGLDVNLTATQFILNFTAITQSWLQNLAKEFMKYNVATHSTGDCSGKLVAIRDFSRFLARAFPRCRVSDIDRALIIEYISALREQKPLAQRNAILGNLRIFLETCAHRLHIPGLTKEQIIFGDDFARLPERFSREIPEGVLVQLREHLKTLPTTTLRMVVILLEVGLRIGELCTLPTDCLICDDKHEWYLRFYQMKSHKEHIIPLVDETVIGTIQAQQQDIQKQWGNACPYLFPNPRTITLPFKQGTFTRHLNEWAVEKGIKNQNRVLWRFQAHQFRHTVGMRLLSDDVPLEVISRLLGHRSLAMTQVYARVRQKQLRTELERVARKRKTVDVQGNIVKGDPRANDPEAQMVRKGMRGQTLPIGGCGRLIVLGECNYANKCLTCPMWLTSTEDLPSLKSFYERATRLKQRATEKGNQFVVDQQEHIIINLATRIKSLEEPAMDGTLAVDEVLTQLRTDLTEAESALDEVRENGLIPAAKYLERSIADLKARIAVLEDPT
jgi:integrase/recombinase XerD